MANVLALQTDEARFYYAHDPVYIFFLNKNGEHGECVWPTPMHGHGRRKETYINSVAVIPS